MRLLTSVPMLALAAGLATAAAADPALVLAVGHVEIGHGMPPLWRAGHSGDPLAPGDSVRTGAGARAELQLGDNRVVRVFEQSVLRVGTSITPTGAVRSVDLDEGQSIFDVMKKTVADEFDVVTPEVVVSVKGTRFLVAAVEGADYTSVFRGVVGLAGDDFDAISVRPGMSGAHGELFLTPFADPWDAWEHDATAPAPAIDDGPEHAGAGAALQAVVGGGSDGGGSGGGDGPGLVGGVVGALDGSGGAPAEGVGSALVAPVGEVTGAVGDVTGALAPVTSPVTGTLDSLVDPVVTPVDDLLGGVLGGNRSP